MISLRVDMNHIHLSLEGVAESTVQEAMRGLDAELRARLMRAGMIGLGETPVEVDHVMVVTSADHLDAASLRTMIAERLVEQIEQAGPVKERD
jgi:hypothetical protein